MNVVMRAQDIPEIFSFVSLRNHTASLDLLVGVLVIWDTLQQWIVGSILEDVLPQVFTALGDLKGKQKEMTHWVYYTILQNPRKYL